MDPIKELWQRVADELPGLRDNLTVRQQLLADKQIEIADLEDALATAQADADGRLTKRVIRRSDDFNDTRAVAEILAKRDDVDPTVVADYIDAILVEPEVV